MLNFREKIIKTENIYNKLKIKPYHFLGITIIFILMISNVARAKISSVYGYEVSSGIYFFSIIYPLICIVTEVYGFKSTMKLVWIALLANIVSSLLLYLATIMPSAPDMSTNEYFDKIFTLNISIFILVIFSFVFGSYLTSIFVARTKVIFFGRYILARFIFSSLMGVIVESFIFYIAMFSKFHDIYILPVIFISLLIKFCYQLILAPIAVLTSRLIKDNEQIDYYDYKTRFTIY